MFEKIPAPVKGQPARASWGAALTSRVNELCAMAPARGLARDGLTGTGYEALPQNLRNRVTSDAVLPWTFICTVSKDENGNETRRGGWYYGQAQLGLDAAWFGELGRKYKPETDMQGVPGGIGGTILHCDQTADGNYYLEVHPGYPKIELKRFGLNEIRPTDDPVEDKWFVYIGTVVDAKQVFGIHCVPVIYKYL